MMPTKLEWGAVSFILMCLSSSHPKSYMRHILPGTCAAHHSCTTLTCRFVGQPQGRQEELDDSSLADPSEMALGYQPQQYDQQPAMEVEPAAEGFGYQHREIHQDACFSFACAAQQPAAMQLRAPRQASRLQAGHLAASHRQHRDGPRMGAQHASGLQHIRQRPSNTAPRDNVAAEPAQLHAPRSPHASATCAGGRVDGAMSSPADSPHAAPGQPSPNKLLQGSHLQRGRTLGHSLSGAPCTLGEPDWHMPRGHAAPRAGPQQQMEQCVLQGAEPYPDMHAAALPQLSMRGGAAGWAGGVGVGAAPGRQPGPSTPQVKGGGMGMREGWAPGAGQHMAARDVESTRVALDAAQSACQVRWVADTGHWTLV